MWQKLKNLYHLTQALLASFYFNFPSKKLTVIGVTGTDGKTTTVNMIYHILKKAGKRVSMISSVNAQIGDKTFDTGFHVSTPSPWQIQKFLRKATDAGSEYFVLEATSHGLDQNRLAIIEFKLCLITNITHEHLDYHRNWDQYAHAKAKLFKNTQFSVLNLDDKSFELLKRMANGKIITYSLKKRADFNLENASIKHKLLGDYNLANALAAYTACHTLGIPKSKITKALSTFAGVKGRMEEIDIGQNFRVFIDFAHTPNGLKQALKTLRSELNAKDSKLIAVFGSAGQRDKSKRPMMGKIAAGLADLIVITSEDPRNEDPKQIAIQITSGIEGKKDGRDYNIIPERKAAIEFAIKKAGQKDIVAIFGKGHEKSMTIGKKETPWDEYKVTEDAIKKKINAK